MGKHENAMYREQIVVDNSQAQTVKRLQPALISIIGFALAIVLLAFPSVGNLVRAGIGSVFGGETLLDIIGGISGIIGIIGAGVWVYEKRSKHRRTVSVDAGNATPVSPQPASELQSKNDDETRRVRDEGRTVARQVRAFVHERDEDDPFSREEVPMNMDSPEYKAIAARYDIHMDETRRLYRTNHLPDVARVRDAFADLGITDPELDRLHENPRNYNEMRTLAARLITMADSLSR
jgi:hypothetical protein